MKIYLVNLTEIASGGFNLDNDYILEVFDSEEKAKKFCEDHSDRLDDDEYLIESSENKEWLDANYRSIIAYVEKRAKYTLWYFTRELK